MASAAQPHLRQSPHGFQGGPEPHLSHLNHAQQRACPCKLCRSLRQASNSPPNREYPCLQAQELRVGADLNEECRYGIHPSHWPAHKASHVPASDHFQGPCHRQVPPSPHMARGAASAHGFTPVASRFSPSSCNQERDRKQNGPRMGPNLNKSLSYGGPPNQVILYHWFLIRCKGSSQGVNVSVGGFLTLGTACTERFTTAAIVQRIEKCRLLAHDGLEIWLAGLIDDCTTVSNGFSVNIVQTFLSGFPYTWNFILNSELCAPNTKDPDHQVSGSCGLGGGAETSQLSFERSDQEKGAPSPSFCDNPEKANNMQLNMKQTTTAEVQSEKANNMELNIKQTMTAEVQSEKEAATLKNNDSIPGPVIEGVEKLDTISSRDDQISNSNSTGLVEQEINNVRIEEGEQENAHVDQSRCKVKKRLGRPSKRQPHIGSEEDGTGHIQIGAGNGLLDKSNGSTETVGELVEKSDKHEQKSQITPRITRSMQKISRHMASSHNISIGVDTRAHCDSLSNCAEVHTPVEQCGPCIKLRSGTTPSTTYQKREDNKRSRRTLPKDNDRDNIDGGKSSNASPCYYTGVKSPIEMGVQRPESPMNAEASPTSKEEGRSIHQEEEFTVEAVQACDYGTTDEEENLFASVQKSKEHASFKSVERLTKASQSELNKREGDILSKSPGQGSKCMKIPPRLPHPRVSVSKRLISAAFGLKTSRSGRLLVPPLAHWCSQALLRDKDGGIIGISEGSKDMSRDGTGYFTFKPPAEAGLRKLQNRLREVATDCTHRKKRLGTKRRQ